MENFIKAARNAGLFLAISIVPACVKAVELIDCNSDGSPGLITAQKYFPSQSLEYLEIFCRDRSELPADCYIEWFGSKYHRARWFADVRYLDACIVHEAYHSNLYFEFGDFCASHTASCNWDSLVLESALDEVNHAF